MGTPLNKTTPHHKAADSNNSRPSRQSACVQWLKHGCHAYFVLSAVLCALSVATLYASYTLNKNTSNTPGAAPQTSHKAGNTITQGDVTMSITDVIRTDNASNTQGQPPISEGMEFTIFTFSIQNNSDKSLQILPSNDTYAKTSDGTTYYLTPTILQNPFRAGELLPGDTIKGELSYLSPKNKSLKLYIDAIWSGKVIPIDLTQ